MQAVSKPHGKLGLLRATIILLGLTTMARPAPASDERSIRLFRNAIVAMAPDVDPREAQMVSEVSYQTARRLKKEWRVVPFALLQNMLIQFGARDRGYCFHWAHGIGEELRKLPLKTLELHWAEAYPNGHLEHNVVVVTARGQPCNSGYIIDAWRAAGHLLWFPVLKDEYPWKENPVETAWLQNRGPDPLAALDNLPPAKPQRSDGSGSAGSLE
jgi:hypothetical protein